MKKIYGCFCLFFISSLFPFLMVEFYFQDFFAFGIIAIFASIVLTLCVSYEYLKVKIPLEHKESYEKIDLVNLLKKEPSKRSSFYFFRKNFW